MRIITVVILTILFIDCFSQKDIREGYVVSNEGDTIFGNLVFKGDIINSKKCIFIDSLEKRTVYYPFDILSYRFKDGKYYISKNVLRQDTIEKVFVEYIVDGQKDLFYFRDYGGLHYLFEYGNDILREVPFEIRTLNKDGKDYEFKTTNHIGFLKNYFSEYPQMFNEIEKIKKPNLNNLTILSTEYHRLSCGNEKCIVYNKKKHRVRVGIEPQYGHIKYKYTDAYARQYGANIYLMVPNVSENIYFKSGYLYSTYTSEYNISRIPVQLQYMVTNKILKPKFDFGVNILKLDNGEKTVDMTMTLASSAGVVLKITNHLFIVIDFEVDYFEFDYETDFFISHSLRSGISMVF